MKAGRELDTLIAEKVMGLTRHDESYVAEGVGKVLRFVWRDGCGTCVYSGDMFLPRYSTNIADAWEVVHKLREGNLWFVIKQDNSSGWEAKFWKGLPDGWFPTEEYYAVALTPALAICLAALKAVSQEGQANG